MAEFIDQYKVVVKDGKQFLTYNGVMLPAQLSTVVSQSVEQALSGEGMCEVTVTFRAQLIDTKD